MADNIPDNPRLITFGEAQQRYAGGCRVIDLGIITNADVFAANNYLELVPYVAGRFIKEVWFESEGWEVWNEALFLFTPNTNVFGSGYALVQQNGDPSDTSALIYAGSGVIHYAGASPGGGYLQSGIGMISDCGPLYATMSSQSGTGKFFPFLTWQPNTKYAVNAHVYGDNDGNLYNCTVGGTSGTAGPPPTDDGTVTWEPEEWTPGGAIHAKALIYDTTDDSCTFPATIEFVQQPTDVVAGEIITPAVTVRLLDQNGDPYAKAQLTVLIEILGAGTLGGSKDRQINTTTGIATFNNLTITEDSTSYTLVATCIDTANVARVISDPFDVTAP